MFERTKCVRVLNKQSHFSNTQRFRFDRSPATVASFSFYRSDVFFQTKTKKQKQNITIIQLYDTEQKQATKKKPVPPLPTATSFHTFYFIFFISEFNHFIFLFCLHLHMIEQQNNTEKRSMKLSFLVGEKEN